MLDWLISLITKDDIYWYFLLQGTGVRSSAPPNFAVQVTETTKRNFCMFRVSEYDWCEKSNFVARFSYIVCSVFDFGTATLHCFVCTVQF